MFWKRGETVVKKYYSESDSISNNKENVFVYIAPMDEGVQSRTSASDNAYDVSEDLELWISSITDCVLRNIRLSRKYICAETVMEYQLIYAYSSERKIDAMAILEDCTKVSMLAENIPSEEISEDDRDEYKEALYAGEIVWSEFCQYAEMENVKIVMEHVCQRLMKELGIDVGCMEGK